MFQIRNSNDHEGKNKMEYLKTCVLNATLKKTILCFLEKKKNARSKKRVQRTLTNPTVLLRLSKEH